LSPIGRIIMFYKTDRVLILVFVELTFWGHLWILKKALALVLILVFVELTFWAIESGSDDVIGDKS